MKTTFRLSNREFPDSFFVTVNGVTKELSQDHEEITFEWDDTEAEGEITYVNHDAPGAKIRSCVFLPTYWQD